MNWKVISIILVVLLCVAVVIYNTARDVYPQSAEQQRGDFLEKLFLMKVKQRYVLYPPTTEHGFTYFVDTETGDVWRMVLNVGNAGPAWVYMPKEPPIAFDEWLKVYKRE